MLMYFVRHGETRLNTERRLAGWTDVPLNANGRELATVTGKALKDVRFDAAFSSPLKRAKETAQLILAENEASDPGLLIHDEARVMEINFGTWEALSIADSNFELPIGPEDYRLFFTDPLRFGGWENGESVHDVVARTGDFLFELAAREDLADATVLVAMHGLSMRALLWHVYEDNSDFWHGKVPPNLAVNIVRAENGKLELIGEDLVYYDDSLIPDYYAEPEHWEEEVAHAFGEGAGGETNEGGDGAGGGRSALSGANTTGNAEGVEEGGRA